MDIIKVCIDMGIGSGYFCNSIMDYVGELEAGKVISLRMRNGWAKLEIVAIAETGSEITIFARITRDCGHGTFAGMILRTWERSGESMLDEIFDRPVPTTV